jgi:hypothetical protein
MSLATTGLSKEISKPFKIEKLQELQRLHFEWIGNLKLIVETKTLIINYNLSDLSTIEHSFKQKIEKVSKVCNEKKQIANMTNILSWKGTRCKTDGYDWNHQAFSRLQRHYRPNKIVGDTSKQGNRNSRRSEHCI